MILYAEWSLQLGLKHLQRIDTKEMPKINFMQLLLLISFVYVMECQNYAVAYILSKANEQRLPNNSIRIYQKFRFESTVHMNIHTRQMYSKLDMLKTLPQVTSQTLFKPEHQGTIHFQRTTLPQHFWIGEKQIVIMEVDISQFPSNKQELQKYSNLFRHKGTQFYMFNTNQVNQTVPAQIGQLFGINMLTDSICQINVRSNTVQENTQLIQSCYEKSIKKQMIGGVNVSFLDMVARYGFMGFIYIVLTSLVACGSPYLMIWWHKKQDQKHSHV